jgi:hypothetical protein
MLQPEMNIDERQWDLPYAPSEKPVHFGSSPSIHGFLLCWQEMQQPEMNIDERQWDLPYAPSEKPVHFRSSPSIHGFLLCWQ